MTYRVIKTDNYDVQIGTAETIDQAVQVIKDFNNKCKFPLTHIEFETDEEHDGLDAFGSNGSSITLFRTEKSAKFEGMTDDGMAHYSGVQL